VVRVVAAHDCHVFGPSPPRTCPAQRTSIPRGETPLISDYVNREVTCANPEAVCFSDAEVAR
jgi:hypothetical protein